MGGSSGSGLGSKIIPGLETAIGAGSEFLAPGNPIGIGMMGSGLGGLGGGSAGGATGMPGIPGVSGSALEDMIGSMNPGGGGEGGLGQISKAAGGGKGTGAAGSAAGGLGSFLQNKDFQNMIGSQGIDLQSMLKPGNLEHAAPPINPGKGVGAPAAITQPQTTIGSAAKSAGGSATDPRLQAILARLMRQR